MLIISLWKLLNEEKQWPVYILFWFEMVFKVQVRVQPNDFLSQHFAVPPMLQVCLAGTFFSFGSFLSKFHYKNSNWRTKKNKNWHTVLYDQKGLNVSIGIFIMTSRTNIFHMSICNCLLTENKKCVCYYKMINVCGHKLIPFCQCIFQCSF